MSGAAGEMPLVEHLRELRTRLFRAVIALAVGTVIGYVVFPLLLELLISPYCQIPNALRPDVT
ncbi:MAG: twin-arginine translocase subunit TatC, partial [Actinomycetota bacterium]